MMVTKSCGKCRILSFKLFLFFHHVFFSCSDKLFKLSVSTIFGTLLIHQYCFANVAETATSFNI